MMQKSDDFLKKLGVTDEGILALTQGRKDSEIDHDLRLLQMNYQNIPQKLDQFAKNFSTYLWTLLGEIGVPNDLGKTLPFLWPILIFPYGLPYLQTIKNWIHKEGGEIYLQNKILITPLLHACLYGGQAWYPALSKAFKESCNEANSEGYVLWLKSSTHQHGTIATIARKLQLHLRPTLPEVKTTIPDQIYPGVQRAFHTPRLENVNVHNLIIQNAI